MLRLVLFALVMLATLVGMLYLFRASLRTWAGDHFRWYRRMRGGRWACWNGFWEQASAAGSLTYLRHYEGFDIAQCSPCYGYKAFLNWDAKDSYITAREDYTAETSSSSNMVASWLIGALAGAVLLAIFSFPLVARADWIARQGDDSVVLTQAPCANEAVLQLLGPDVRDTFHAASAVFQGQKFEACWRPLGSVAHLVYEDGDQGFVPLADIKPLRET